MDDRVRAGVVQRRDRGGDVLAGLGDALLGDDLDALELRGSAEVLEVRLADVRALDQHASRRLPGLRHQVRPQDRLVAHRPVVQEERPLAQPVLGAADADRRHLEPTFHLGAHRHRVLADVRPDHRDAALVDELAERVDRLLHVALRQALRAAVVDLDRAVDQARRVPVAEDQLHRFGVVRPVVGAAAEVVHEEADLDRRRLTRF